MATAIKASSVEGEAIRYWQCAQGRFRGGCDIRHATEAEADNCAQRYWLAGLPRRIEDARRERDAMLREVRVLEGQIVRWGAELAAAEREACRD